TARECPGNEANRIRGGLHGPDSHYADGDSHPSPFASAWGAVSAQLSTYEGSRWTNPYVVIRMLSKYVSSITASRPCTFPRAAGDPRDLASGVLHVDRELAPLIAVSGELRRLDLRLDDGRHEGGLALLVEVMRCEVDRIHGLDEEEPSLRRGQLDPVRRPLRHRDVHVLPEFQVAVLGPDDALAVLDEVHLVPLPVPEEGLLRHRFRRLG